MYQFVFKCFAYILPWREPQRLEGKDGMRQLADVARTKNKRKALIITDNTIYNLNLMDDLMEQLTAVNIEFIVYRDVVQNPTVANIEQALVVYKEALCDFIIAFGGGSPMDCAKGVAARVVRPNRSIQSMKGQLKVRKKMPRFLQFQQRQVQEVKRL